MNATDCPSRTFTWLLSGQFSDDQSVRTIPIESSPFTVGRRPDQALTIPSPTVSSRHAEMLMEEDTLVVRDLGSTNGTFVNGVRIEDRCVIKNGDLVQFADVVFRASRNAVSLFHATVQENSADRALALIQFDKLITERAVSPHFQPIITMDDRTVVGYEILGRSRLFGLSDPATMFQAAAVLNMEAELSRMFRQEGVKHAALLPGHCLLFANTHPTEVDDPEVLMLSLRELRAMAPTRPIVLEIHEATATQTGPMRELRAELNQLAIGLAYDDFGAGQARLVELVEVPPDYLKFDMKLVQNLHLASVERQKMVERLVQMTLELGIIPLAEGVETEEDHALCLKMGFACGQGYLYGRPAVAASFLK